MPKRTRKGNLSESRRLKLTISKGKVCSKLNTLV